MMKNKRDLKELLLDMGLITETDIRIVLNLPKIKEQVDYFLGTENQEIADRLTQIVDNFYREIGVELMKKISEECHSGFEL